MQDGCPPGSRAKLASVLAASTVPGYAQPRAADHAADTPVTSAPSASTRATGTFRAQARNQASARSTAFRVARGVVEAEAQATRLAALALVETRRQAAAADRYVRRNPWTSVMLAAVAGLAAATAARRNSDDRAEAEDRTGER
jgi:membrane protein